MSFDYQLDNELQLLMDTDKVEKIIMNFISNALKFTTKNGSINLTVRQEEQYLQVSVTDTGVGILPSDINKVFDRFYQTKKENQQNGTGIGLSLCRELAKVLNGEVWAESEVGKGSVFHLKLPFVETFSAQADSQVIEEGIIPIIFSEETTTPSNNNYQPIILIVEDNPDLRHYIASILSGYQVVVTRNGKEALQYLKDNRQPSLIVSDIMMPEMDGMELLEAVKSNDDLRHIPMIMLTARQSMEVKLNALRIGVDDYITKPFKEAELIIRVKNLIENSQSRLNTPIEEVKDKSAPILSPADIKWLEEVETFISKEIANPQFSLTATAEHFNISPRRFQQKIKQHTGLTPKKYQRNIQLEFARRLLRAGDMKTIAEVSYAVGIESPHYFSKLYQKHFGISPRTEI